MELPHYQLFSVIITNFEDISKESLVFCILRTPTDSFAEQNGRVAELAD